MPNIFKTVLGPLVFLFVLLVLIGPSPATRGLFFSSEALAALALWHDGIKYLAYLSELLLILFFGGFVFMESFGRQVAATLGTVADRNVEALNQAIADAGDNTTRMTAYLQKFATQGTLARAEWRALLKTMFALQGTAANPLHLIRGTLWILGHLPGRLYGALALVLVLVKIFAEMALILITG